MSAWRKPLFCLLLGTVLLIAAACSENDDESQIDFSQLPQLSYTDEDGALWLVYADGTGQRKLVDDAGCSQMKWSPTGETLVCQQAGRALFLDGDGKVRGELVEPALWSTYWSPSGSHVLYATSTGSGQEVVHELHLSDDVGITIADLGPWASAYRAPPQQFLGSSLWSPNGENIFYSQEDTGAEVIYSVESGLPEPLEDDYYPLGWTSGGDSLLVSTNYKPPPEYLAGSTYEVSVVNLVDGALTRIPVLDNGVQFWISPGGSKAVYVIPGFAPVDGGTVPGLGVVDLRSSEATPIAASIITYGSEGIPKDFVTFSDDGQYVYWNGGDGGAYRARLDGTGHERILDLESFFFEWAPDASMIAYAERPAGDAPAILYVTTSDGGDTYELANLGNPRLFAWRPIPR